ncbi:MAG TPA: hypothetical protein VMG14_08215 [Thermoplasmata archaeon]|nr:hypothetical protein [Thermoplasmata archaeon]
MFAVALVAIVVAGGLGLLSAPGSPAPAGASPVNAHPTAASAPVIYGFFSSPSEFFEGSSTFLIVSASGSGTLDYTYQGLPPGCASSDTSFLYCAPSGYGFFNVSVSVTSGGSGPAAVAYTTLSVDAVVDGNFFSYNASVAGWSSNSTFDCSSIQSPPFYQYFCDPQVQSPSLAPLPNGSVGVAYQQETSATSNPCGGNGSTEARVEFQLSDDNGTSFGNATDLGNDTCTYLNAIEPSFVATNDTVYGAFVEENSSALPWLYTNRTGDAIGFVASTDGGLNFSAVKTVRASGNLARPSIAAIGSTIYLAYEDIANSTATIGGGVAPISVWFQVSKDGGATWSTAHRLEGLGGGQKYTSSSPAVAVGPDGAVTVAYTSDRVCSVGTAANCSAWTDSIVSVTSTDNGTAWSSPPVVIAKGAGETSCFSGGCFPGYFQSTPEISLSYAPTGALYVAYAATYDQDPGTPQDFNYSGLFAAESNNDGATWTASAVDAPLGGTSVRYYEPAIAASASTVYLSYLAANETAGQFGFANSLSNFVQSIPTGSATGWSSPTATDIESFVYGGSVNGTRGSFPGATSAVTVTATGRPMIAFALPGSVSSSITRAPSYYYANTSTPSQLVVGALVLPTDPDALAEVFQQTGIPNGVNWSFSMDGASYTLATPQIEFLNVPEGEPVMVGAYFTPGFWEIDSSFFNATETEFFFPTTTQYPFEVWVGLEFGFFPSPLSAGWSFDPYSDIFLNGNLLYSPFPAYVYASDDFEGDYFCNPICTAQVYNYWDYFSSFGGASADCANTICAWPTPWYFPLGSTVQIEADEWNYFGLTPTYWTGEGAGSYTGLMQGYCYYSFECDVYSGDITMDGPINETMWLADGPVSLNANLTVSSYGLPAGSVYHFDLNGVPYSANASAPVEVANAAPGAYDVTSVWASSSTAGWDYFGGVNGQDPFLSPLETSVNLTFPALVHVAASLGTVTFHAPALTSGTYWSIELNGTTYASTTPWINVTARPGTYPYSVNPSTSATGSAGYVPTAAGPTISVVTGRTYSVGFVPAYLVRAIASPGGLISINGGAPQSAATAWVASGSTVSLTSEISSGYSFVGWSGTGTGSYSGTSVSPTAVANGPLVESAAFAPLPGARFNLTLVASGLPSGTWWSAQLGGVGESTNLTSMTIGNLWPWTAANNLGVYSVSVPDVYLNGTTLTRFVPVSPPSAVGTNGSFTPNVVIAFAAQSFFQLNALDGGVVEGTFAGAPTGSSAWLPVGANVSFEESPNPGYTFVGWIGTGPGSYSGNATSASIELAGPVTEVATFAVVVAAAPPRYSLTFDLATTLAAGTVWTVDVGGTGYSSDGPSLTVSGLLAGTYSISVGAVTAPGGLVQYRPTATDPAAYTVRGNGTLDLSYDLYYWVSVASSVGGTVSPGDGYYAAGSVLYLVASPSAGDSFVGWTGSGSGNYTGLNTTASLFVLGSLNETATFRATSSAVAASSVWSNPETWIGVGAVALLAGLVVGLVVARVGAASRGTNGRGGRPERAGTTSRGGSP